MSKHDQIAKLEQLGYEGLDISLNDFTWLKMIQNDQNNKENTPTPCDPNCQCPKSPVKHARSTR